MSNFLSKINKCSQEFKKIITPRYQQLFGEHYLENNIKETLLGEQKEMYVYLGSIIKGTFFE